MSRENVPDGKGKADVVQDAGEAHLTLEADRHMNWPI
jgi:hypothetical protein